MTTQGKRVLLAAILGVSLLVWIVAAVRAQPRSIAAPDPTAQIERGRYLVAIMSCGDCHTPMKLGPEGPVPDLSRLLSGHPQELKMPPAPALGDGPWVWTGSGTNTAYAGPWGVTFAPNLTPDPDTGIGAWTEEIFVNALRTGKHWGQSRAIQPPMPIPATRQLTDEDIRAVWTYLRSIPAIKNRVPDYASPADLAEIAGD